MGADTPSAFFSYSREDAQFALRLAEDLKAAGANVWMDQLDIEQDNFTHALAWCFDSKGDPNVGAELAAAIGWHWIGRGRSNLARRWLDRALEFGEHVGAANRIALQVAYALLAYATTMNMPLTDLQVRVPTLEDVFLELTGRALRGDALFIGIGAAWTRRTPARGHPPPPPGPRAPG